MHSFHTDKEHPVCKRPL